MIFAISFCGKARTVKPATISTTRDAAYAMKRGEHPSSRTAATQSIQYAWQQSSRNRQSRCVGAAAKSSPSHAFGCKKSFYEAEGSYFGGKSLVRLLSIYSCIKSELYLFVSILFNLSTYTHPQPVTSQPPSNYTKIDAVGRGLPAEKPLLLFHIPRRNR